MFARARAVPAGYYGPVVEMSAGPAGWSAARPIARRRRYRGLGITDAEAAAHAQKCATNADWTCAGGGAVVTQARAYQILNEDWNASQQILYQQAVDNWRRNDGRRYVNGVYMQTDVPPPPPTPRATEINQLVSDVLNPPPWQSYNAPGVVDYWRGSSVAATAIAPPAAKPPATPPPAGGAKPPATPPPGGGAPPPVTPPPGGGNDLTLTGELIKGVPNWAWLAAAGGLLAMRSR